jgi:hypothetical protein
MITVGLPRTACKQERACIANDNSCAARIQDKKDFKRTFAFTQASAADGHFEQVT